MHTSSTTHEHLSRVQRAAFAAMLDEQRRFRTEQIADCSDHETHSSETAAAREVREIVLAGAAVALDDINAAIGRLADGRYGRCIQCDEPIALERLEILPHAARCLGCERAL